MGMKDRKVIINFTNHPSSQWSPEQIKAAQEFGEIQDLPFPQISPSADRKEVIDIAQMYVQEILQQKPEAVICQGEFTLAYSITKRLREEGVPVLAACSERMVREKVTEKGTQKEVLFQFKGFREYE